MDFLDRWFRENIDERPCSPAERARDAKEAEEEQLDTFCELCALKEEEKFVNGDDEDETTKKWYVWGAKYTPGSPAKTVDNDTDLFHQDDDEDDWMLKQNTVVIRKR